MDDNSEELLTRLQENNKNVDILTSAIQKIRLVKVQTEALLADVSRVVQTLKKSAKVVKLSEYAQAVHDLTAASDTVARCVDQIDKATKRIESISEDSKNIQTKLDKIAKSRGIVYEFRRS